MRSMSLAGRHSGSSRIGLGATVTAEDLVEELGALSGMNGSPVVSIGDGCTSASRLSFTRSRSRDTGSCYAITAVIAMAIGILIRHSAGVISLLLIYNLPSRGSSP